MRLLLDTPLARLPDDLPGGLERAGWTVTVAPMEGTPALGFSAASAAAALIDGERPHADLRQLVSFLRAQHPGLLLMLLAGSQSRVRELLQAGASDFVLPPFRVVEIDARIRARMAEPDQLNLGPCVVDLGTHRAVWPGREVSLTATEVKLLVNLWRNAGRTVSREDLLVAVWGYQVAVDTRAVALATSRLRRKIEVEPDRPRHLLTVYGVGYRLEVNPPQEVAEAPRWRPFQLPTPAEGLVGREALVAQVAERVVEAGARVVLLGPGGIGKTRVAVEVGHRLAGGREVIYVDASHHEGLLALVHTVLRGLGAPEVDDAEAYAALGRVLGGRPVLWILDNFEHLASAAAPLMAALVGAGELGVLVTSRLRVEGGGPSQFGVPALELEDGCHLFASRVYGLRPELPRGPEVAALMRAIVVTLDGLPLAIELAAGRVLVLGLAEIHRRLGRRFELLGAPGRPGDRHQSLMRTLDDSWSLLTEPLRRALVACVVFKGGFDIEAAERVLPEDGASVVDRVQLLMNHSLLQVMPGPSAPRFSLLESVAAYLEGKGGLDGARDRHLSHYVDVAVQLCQDMLGPDVLTARERFELEHANLLVAFAWGVRTQPDAAARLVIELSQVYWMLALPGALALLERVPEGVSRDLRLHLGVQRARHLLRAGRFGESRALVEDLQVETAAEPLHHAHVFAMMLASSLDLAEGQLHAALGRADLITERLERLGLRRLLGVHLVELSSCFRRLGRLEDAKRTQERALGLVVGEGARWNEMLIRSHLGLVYHLLGELDAARGAITPALVFFDASRDRRSALTSRLNLAIIAMEGADLGGAEAELERVAPLVAQVGTDLDRAFERCVAARLSVCQGRWDEALARVEETLRLTGGRRTPTACHAWCLRMWVHHLRGETGPALDAAAEAVELYTAVHNDLEIGRLRLRQACLHADRGEVSAAVARWGEALTRLYPTEMPVVAGLSRITWAHLSRRGVSVPVDASAPQPLDEATLTRWRDHAPFYDQRWAAALALAEAPPGAPALIQL